LLGGHMHFFERSQRADIAPVPQVVPTPAIEATDSALVHRMYLAIVGTGRAPGVSRSTSAPEACPAATKRPPVITGFVTDVPAVFSRVVCAHLEC
jgi:hypothetical protein